MEQVFGRNKQVHNTNDEGSEHWISMADLMSGLMMVFMLIAIAFMQYVQMQSDKIKEVAVTYQNAQVAIYEQLLDEFKDDLPLWDAEIDQNTLEFRFKAPEVLFATGKIEIQPRFATILSDFFPRYLGVIKNFKDSISEIRIEGHTSSEWSHHSTATESYFNNMELSQGRTRSVLQYVYNLPSINEEQDWIKSKFAAVGFSSSHVLLDAFGNEDAEASKRVSFKVNTNAETQIRKILTN